MNRERAALIALVILLSVASAVAGSAKQYKNGILERWDMLSTGTECNTHQGLISGISTRCARNGVRTYHIVTEDGFDYMVQPDTWDPFKAFTLGQEIDYRIDEKGQFWTPDPKHGSCPWPCTGEKRRKWKEIGDASHEAKYFVNLVTKRTADKSPTMTNKDVADMARLGLGETIIIAKINASKPAFEVGVEALASLKEQGVSDNVIAAMLQRSSQHMDQ